MRAEIDGDLLAEVRTMAEEQGRSGRELLDEAVRSYLSRRRVGLKEPRSRTRPAGSGSRALSPSPTRRRCGSPTTSCTP